MKRQRLAYRPAWTHHPRGGKITGFAGPVRPGLYSPERGLATTEAAARAGEFFHHAPAAQVFPTTPTPMKTPPIIDMQNPPAGAIPATEEQLAALGVTPAEIAAGEKRHDTTHTGPWYICTSLAAIVGCKDYRQGPHGLTETARARFWPGRRMSRPRESGYQMEGTVSLGGRKIPAFTSSQLFELPDGRLIDVATLHLCHRTAAGDRNLAAIA